MFATVLSRISGLRMLLGVWRSTRTVCWVGGWRNDEIMRKKRGTVVFIYWPAFCIKVFAGTYPARTFWLHIGSRSAQKTVSNSGCLKRYNSTTVADETAGDQAQVISEYCVVHK